MGNGVISCGVKRLELDVEPSPFSAEVGNEWSCTYTAPSYLYGIYMGQFCLTVGSELTGM